MSQEYKLQKWVWTEADFENMSWHDSRIYALAFSPDTFELLLDIDYIFQWVNPEQGENSFRFWVAPATLVFRNVYEVEFDVLTTTGLEIDNLTRSEPRAPRNAAYIERDVEWSWTIDCQQGDIKLWSIGYNQYIRSTPQFGQTQKLELEVRGGYSFAKGPANAV
jgi:hypothetical protein